MFHKHNNINTNSPLAVNTFDQDQWKKNTVCLFWPSLHSRNNEKNLLCPSTFSWCPRAL